ncbi:conserved hypothetical protein [Chloroherpeton thalassium ATCC 35110]|uniref:Rpn family recombination-promoting nuclease/putative transposase n=1 Tax=Chloroherpeton thalassium (strain ATCC 35110 / GB-78) TaxID=517418 RepID=B3QUJ9_CHLT3|nr:Rpn family recombination-promoting nuclease/putative transposase [Chloroherpeton thalassium]ACF12905.1 conserved hypothetical protein [Chloroherpeton thalassium ATCC 35110]
MSYLQEKYINPLTDFGFKKLFGTEPNKILLMDFLNQILPEKHQIQELSYSKNEHVGQQELDRKAIFDVYCVGQSGERFIVEVQKAKQNYFKDRSIYYASFPIQEQAKRGNWDDKLEPVYTVGILDFIFDDHKLDAELIHVVALKKSAQRSFSDKLKFIYIELPKFKKTEAELETQFDKWLYVFRHLSQLQKRPTKFQEKIFEKLFEAAEIAKFSKNELVAYEESLKYYRDMKNVVDTSKEEGWLEGQKAGCEQRNYEIARVLKAKGMPIQEISEITGLTAQEIEHL